MLNIDATGFIGEGSHRACYVHPNNDERCIKIGEIDSSESRRERKHYALLEKRNISWECLSRFYGIVETNMGRGAVFDLVRDYDGGISKSLEYYLDSKNKTELLKPNIVRAIGSLKSYLFEHAILARTLLPENILYKKTSREQGRLVIIDNIGNTDLIPICDYSKFFARKKLLRKWRRFEELVCIRYEHCDESDRQPPDSATRG